MRLSWKSTWLSCRSSWILSGSASIGFRLRSATGTVTTAYLVMSPLGGLMGRPMRPWRGLGAYFIAPISRRYLSAPGWKGMGMPFVACSAVISFAEGWMA